MSEHQVSIIIPVHNAARFIGDAVQSLKEQTYKDFELILVNDASEDDSLAIINDLRQEYDNITVIDLREPHGAAGARNAGLDAAKGRYITFLDADDMWEPEKLEIQVKFMESEHAAFSFTGYEFADENGTSIDRIVRVPKKLSYAQALKNTTIFTSTVMFDTDEIPISLLHMPDVPSEDTATWWQILKNGYVAHGIDRPLTLYRRSSGTLSSNKCVAIKRIWNLYRNVEHLSFLHSLWCFCFYALHAVGRRL